MFLPRGIQHGYTIRSKGDVRLLVMTTPAQTSKRFLRPVNEIAEEGM
jgi:hypothetical protein